MSGLLHRLAARASGKARLVRADLPPLFGSAPLAAFEPAAEPVFEPAFEPASDASRQPRTTTAPVAARAPTSAFAAPIRTHVPERGAAPPAVADRAPGPRRPPQPMLSGAFAAVDGRPRSATAARRSALQDHDAPEPLPPATARRTPPAAEAPAMTRVMPAPMLPARTETVRDTAALVARTADRSVAMFAEVPAAATDTEVHIHIGRIEVTAVQESAAPARPRPRERVQPMSLDAYLARKAGGR